MKARFMRSLLCLVVLLAITLAEGHVTKPHHPNKTKKGGLRKMANFMNFMKPGDRNLRKYVPMKKKDGLIKKTYLMKLSKKPGGGRRRALEGHN